jgi:hypothetical protein
MIETTTLIRQLAADRRPLRPLAQPWVRTLRWVAISLLALVVLALLWPHAPIGTSLDRQFFMEQAAALLTGVMAATAAFASVVPGYSRRVALLVLIPLAIWLAVLGHACVQDWSDSERWASVLLRHWACVPATLLAGVVPAIVLLVMLRRGAPLAPARTTALAGVAVAGHANVLMRVVHASDASLIVLAWHVLALLAVSAASTLGGRYLFTWRHARPSDGVSR